MTFLVCDNIFRTIQISVSLFKHSAGIRSSRNCAKRLKSYAMAGVSSRNYTGRPLYLKKAIPCSGLSGWRSTMKMIYLHARGDVSGEGKQCSSAQPREGPELQASCTSWRKPIHTFISLLLLHKGTSQM